MLAPVAESWQLLVGRIESKSCTLAPAAEAAGVSVRTAYRWLRRWREEGAEGLLTGRRRRTRFRIAPRPTGWQAIAALRRLRMSTAELVVAAGAGRCVVASLITR